MIFDYHRAMTDAVVEKPDVHRERLVWIMNDTHRANYRHFLKSEMGVDPDDSEAFGIPIETGEPSNGEPFELRVRPTH
jgi:hypothetical protein